MFNSWSARVALRGRHASCIGRTRRVSQAQRTWPNLGLKDALSNPSNCTGMLGLSRSESFVQPSRTHSRHQVDVWVPVWLLLIAFQWLSYEIDDSFLAKSPKQYAMHMLHESWPSVLWFGLRETIGKDHDVLRQSAKLPT